MREASCSGTLQRASVGYTLTYTYRERDLSVAWCPMAGAGIYVGGWAEFQPTGADSCVMVCDLWLNPGGAMTTWDDPLFDAHAPLAVTSRFHDFASRVTRALSEEITRRRAAPLL